MRTANGSAVLGISGWKNSGKTTLVERLTEALVGRGYHISTLKHAHHAFDIDHEGTDSHRHRSAGASEVLLISKHRWAMVGELRGAPEPTFEEALDRIAPCDLILVEGYRACDHPKLEVRLQGQNTSEPLPSSPETIAAVVSDGGYEGDKPHFHFDELEAITNFVEQLCGLRGRDGPSAD